MLLSPGLSLPSFALSCCEKIPEPKATERKKRAFLTFGSSRRAKRDSGRWRHSSRKLRAQVFIHRKQSKPSREKKHYQRPFNLLLPASSSSPGPQTAPTGKQVFQHPNLQGPFLAQPSATFVGTECTPGACRATCTRVYRTKAAVSCSTRVRATRGTWVLHVFSRLGCVLRNLRLLTIVLIPTIRYADDYCVLGLRALLKIRETCQRAGG